MSDLAVFDQYFRQWAYAACADWGYPPPGIEWFEAGHARLPVGLRTELGRGLAANTLRSVDGHGFLVANGGGGPYRWFEPSDHDEPVPRWATFVQAAEYTRVVLLVRGTELAVEFVDESLAVVVRRGEDVLWSIEAMETFAEVYDRSRSLDRLGVGGVRHDIDDQSDAALRAARWIVAHRPLYFSMVGIGGRLDFSVAVHDTHHFDIIPDLVPVGSHA